MATTIGDQQLQLADDFAEALDRIGDRSTENTRKALQRAIRATLRDLRRWYSAAVDPTLPAERSADGALRRPASYAIAESSRKLTELQRIAQAFFSTAELRALEQRYATDLEQATALGLRRHPYGRLQLKIAWRDGQVTGIAHTICESHKIEPVLTRD